MEIMHCTWQQSNQNIQQVGYVDQLCKCNGKSCGLRYLYNVLQVQLSFNILMHAINRKIICKNCQKIKRKEGRNNAELDPCLNTCTPFRLLKNSYRVLHYLNKFMYDCILKTPTKLRVMCPFKLAKWSFIVWVQSVVSIATQCQVPLTRFF